MNKEKEIEIIAQAQGNDCKNNNRSCKECIIKNGGECFCYVLAKIIFKKGIRVADEVRNETAREILHDVWDRLGDGAENDGIILSLFKKYGVEVDV